MALNSVTGAALAMASRWVINVAVAVTLVPASASADVSLSWKVASAHGSPVWFALPRTRLGASKLPLLVGWGWGWGVVCCSESEDQVLVFRRCGRRRAGSGERGIGRALRWGGRAGHDRRRGPGELGLRCGRCGGRSVDPLSDERAGRGRVWQGAPTGMQHILREVQFEMTRWRDGHCHGDLPAVRRTPHTLCPVRCATGPHQLIIASQHCVEARESR